MASAEDFNMVVDKAIADKRFRRMLFKDAVQAARGMGITLSEKEGEEITAQGPDGLEKVRRPV